MCAAPTRKPRSFRILSWNVNGLRSVHQRGLFLPWLTRSKAAFVGLQEVRASVDQLPDELLPRRWHREVVAAETKGYSGVGFYSRHKPDTIVTSLGDARFDREGRYLEARLGRLTIVTAYFPNGNGSLLDSGKRSNDRIPYKLDFYRAVFSHLEARRAAGEPILVMGDFNTAHRELDLARPRENRNTSGFTELEREELDRWLRSGWTDTFRHVHGDVEGAYSWWSQRVGVREKNIGWRLDLVLASPGAMPHLRDAFIHAHVTGSDHCPVGVELDPAVLAG
jgi:exodeoxyribonuclease-3